MSSYKQLTLEERYQIYALLQAGHENAEIAEHLGLDRSTIYREVKRNCGKRGYRPRQAHMKAIERRGIIPNKTSIDERPVIVYDDP